ncbi:MAG: hypoxanthine phosphoribosyltransferase [Dysgonamonadaceae bacterium]|jgi:hypoxanthine phosphoribosyltransferase|nr:hypoxanthine phosphoribosyltransferase [Dysgonamonadaceae bacterium]
MNEIRLKDKKFELFLSEETVIEAIDSIATQLYKDLRDKKPLFIVVLNGAFMFASDLIRRFDFPCEIAFIRLKSYQGLNRNEQIKEVQGLDCDITHRHVVIVEDIVDTGHTMAYLSAKIKEKAPASLKTVSLLFKPQAFQMDVEPDYTAISIPNDFIVGYGLDYDGWGRNLRNIYKIKD